MIFKFHYITILLVFEMHLIYKTNYKGVDVSVAVGDITKIEVDAIVNPANSQMIMGGGVAGAIKRAGGSIIEMEAMRHAPVPVGKAIATTAGKLKAKYVIHTPTMEKPAMKISIKNVQLAMKAALDCAKNLGIKNIAFPGLGTGVGGVPLSEAAKTMVNELKKHIDEGTTLKEVILVGFKEDLANEFKKALEIYLK